MNTGKLTRFIGFGMISTLAMCATVKTKRNDSLTLRVERLEQRVDMLETDYTLDSASPSNEP